MLASLAVVIGIILIFHYLSKRWTKSSLTGKTLPRHIRIVESRFLAPKKNLVLVEVAGEYLLLSSCGDNLNFIKQVDMIENIEIVGEIASVPFREAFQEKLEKHGCPNPGRRRRIVRYGKKRWYTFLKSNRLLLAGIVAALCMLAGYRNGGASGLAFGECRHRQGFQARRCGSGHADILSDDRPVSGSRSADHDHLIYQDSCCPFIPEKCHRHTTGAFEPDSSRHGAVPDISIS